MHKCLSCQGPTRLTDLGFTFCMNENCFIYVAETKKDEKVNHPSHYNQVPGIECIEVTRWFNFNIGNAIKYIWRAGYKGDKAEDLKKAIGYLEDEIKRIGNE